MEGKGKPKKKESSLKAVREVKRRMRIISYNTNQRKTPSKGRWIHCLILKMSMKMETPCDYEEENGDI